MVTEERMGHKSGIYVFEIDESSPVQSNEPVVLLRPSPSKATVAAWSHLDKYIVAGHEDGSITLFDWKYEEVSRRTAAHDDTITDLQMSKDGT
ncbi:translation initiation factor eIF3 subunit, partial [Linderina macrospora]